MSHEFTTMMPNLKDAILQIATIETRTVAGISLRAWGVPQPAINILLETMETMRFFLCTGFGESKQSYGGTHGQQLAGYGQGNAALGPGFTALSSLIVKAYLRKGHGAQIYSSYL